MSQRHKQNRTTLLDQGKDKPYEASAASHTPGLSGFGRTGSFGCCPCCLLGVLGTGSLFSLETFVPGDFFMNNPSVATFDSSVLDFFVLCFGVPKGDEKGTESC